jgi:hypothetical protein
LGGDPLAPLADTGSDRVQLKAEIALVIEGFDAIALGFGQQSILRVRVVYPDGTSVPGVNVDWQLGPSAQGSYLNQVSTVSGSDGRVAVTLTAGTVRASFGVKALAAQFGGGTVSSAIQVSVSGDYSGSLRVTYGYGGDLELKDLVTRVHDGVLDCNLVDSAVLPPFIAERTAPRVSSTLLFPDLAENEQYSVTAVALSSAGYPVAFGCAVTDRLVGRTTNVLHVPMELDPVVFVGDYDFGTRLHLTDTLPGVTGTIIADLDAFFHDPANVLAEILIDQVARRTGWSESTPRDGWDPDSVEGLLSGVWTTYYFMSEGLTGSPDVDGDGMYVDDAMTYFLFDNLPEWVDDTLVVGGDLTRLVSNLDVGGDMAIESVVQGWDERGDVHLSMNGHWDWNSFLWQWRLGECAAADVCCNRVIYSGEEMGLRPMGADFHATAAQRDSAGRLEYNFQIAEHRLDLQYGTLLTFAVETFMLPALTGEESIECAVESLFGCDGEGVFDCGAVGSTTSTDPDADACGCARVGQWLAEQLRSLGLSETAGESICELALDRTAEYLRTRVGELAWDGTDGQYLTFSAEGTLSDDDLDVRTDLLEAATVGIVSAMDGVSTSFTGDLVADRERAACVADASCAGNESCRVFFHPQDDCSGREVCGPSVGTRRAHQGCTVDTQCKSGTCLDNGRCFTACSENADCPSTRMECESASVPVGDRASLDVMACMP